MIVGITTCLIGFFISHSFMGISMSIADKSFNRDENGSKLISTKTIAECIDDLYACSDCYHNAHAGTSITRNDTLEASAQDWAEKMKANGRLAHSDDETCGENVWAGSPSLCSDAVRDFHKEEDDYDYSYNCDSDTLQNCGHFTQVVWKDSTQIGIGMACTSSKCYGCFKYFPPGNYVNECDENVFPPDSTVSTC